MTNLTKQFELQNVDWTIAGAGDARDGTASLSLTGMSGTLKNAFLYWGELNFSGSSDTNISFNGTSVTGTRLGTSVDTCWSSDHSIGYFADVTSLVSGNGTFNITGMGRGGQGASLVVVYDDGNVNNNRDLTFYAGNDSTDGSGQITTINLGNIAYDKGAVNVALSVGDGQSFTDGELQVNGTSFGTNQFQGASGALWDLQTYDITSILSKGDNAVQITHESDDDCLQFVSAIVDKKASTEILFLDFDTAIPIDYYVTSADFLSLIGITSKETSATKAGTEPLGVFTNWEKGRLVTLVQEVFDRSGIAIKVTSTKPANGDYHSVRFTSTKLSYDSDGDGNSDTRLLGEAFQGIDRFDEDKNNIVAVLMDGNDALADVAETIAHEGAHSYGVRHINPVQNNGSEVMDYHSAATETFVKTIANIVEPPLDGEAATSETHNPTYHIRRYVLGESAEQLKMEGILPGTWDRGFFNNIAYSLGLADLQVPLESLSLLISEQTALVEGAGLTNDLGQLIPLGTGVGNQDQITFNLPEGVAFQIVGSSNNDGVLDVVLEVDPTSSDPFTLVSDANNQLAGNLVTGTSSSNKTSLGTASLAVTAVTQVSAAAAPELTATVAKDTLNENGDSTLLTISRGTLTAGDLVVTVSSDDTSEVSVPASVTILDGQSEAQLTLTALNDTLFDGVQTATISALADGFQTGSVSVDVVDDESQTLGTSADDTLDGTTGDDQIFGLEGNDVMNGLEGNDLLGGGSGDDTISANAGDDTITGRSGNDDIRGGSGRDSIEGDDGNDFLRGGKQEDTILGGDGNDVIRGQSHGDDISGGAGNDNIKGGGGNDTLRGDAGSDFLKGGTRRDSIEGGDGNDRLFGNSFDDTLNGGAGTDTLSGGGQNDRLIGGADNDRLKGGADNDTFVFDLGAGSDLIVDYNTAEDTLELTTALVNGQSAAQVAALAQVVTAGVLIDFGDVEVLLEGLTSTTGLEASIDIV